MLVYEVLPILVFPIPNFEPGPPGYLNISVLASDILFLLPVCVIPYNLLLVNWTNRFSSWDWSSLTVLLYTLSPKGSLKGNKPPPLLPNPTVGSKPCLFKCKPIALPADCNNVEVGR